MVQICFCTYLHPVINKVIRSILENRNAAFSPFQAVGLMFNRYNVADVLAHKLTLLINTKHNVHLMRI